MKDMVEIDVRESNELVVIRQAVSGRRWDFPYELRAGGVISELHRMYSKVNLTGIGS